MLVVSLAVGAAFAVALKHWQSSHSHDKSFLIERKNAVLYSREREVASEFALQRPKVEQDAALWKSNNKGAAVASGGASITAIAGSPAPRGGRKFQAHPPPPELDLAAGDYVYDIPLTPNDYVYDIQVDE